MLRRILTTLCLIFAVIQPASAQDTFGGILLPTTRVIHLVGEINDDSVRPVMDRLHLLDDGSEITLVITSQGGSVYSGLMLYDAMKSLRSPVRTVCEGYCMSMGALILAAGNVREAYPSATILVHQVSSKAEGSLSSLQNDLKETERLQQMMDDIFVKNTGRTLEQIRAIESFDHFMSASEAKKYGFIDDVITPPGLLMRLP